MPHDPLLSLPLGGVHVGYWRHARVSVELSSQGPQWTWRSIRDGLTELENYFEASINNQSPIKVSITTTSRRRLAFKVTKVPMHSFQHQTRAQHIPAGKFLGEAYTDDDLPEDACNDLIDRGLASVRTHRSGDTIPDGWLKIFGSSGVSLIIKVGRPIAPRYLGMTWQDGLRAYVEYRRGGIG